MNKQKEQTHEDTNTGYTQTQKTTHKYTDTQRKERNTDTHKYMNTDTQTKDTHKQTQNLKCNDRPRTETGYDKLLDTISQDKHTAT